MIFNVKKHLLLACIITISNFSLAMEQPVNRVFSNPRILTNLVQHLEGPDFYRFACISKLCNEITKSNVAKERLVANAVAKRENSPIRYVLRQADGEEVVELFGIKCSTINIIQLLMEKGFEFLDEKLISINDRFNHDQAITEEQVIEHVAHVVQQYPYHAIALDLTTNNLATKQITESLINKLANYPIISLDCMLQNFPDGLSCLSAFKQLRSLYIHACKISGDTTIPEQLFRELPLLRFLQVTGSGITAISSAIGTLKHLAHLDLSYNKISALPQELHNLQKLKVLLLEGNPLSKETIMQSMPLTHDIRYLSLPSTGPNTNPLPESGDLRQLKSLTLHDSLQPLLANKKQLKNLENVQFYFRKNTTELFGFIEDLPALKTITAELTANSTLSYQTICGIAQQIKHCDIIVTGPGPHPEHSFPNVLDCQFGCIKQIKQVAKLWQFVQTNRELIETCFDVSDSDPFKHQIKAIKLLFKTTISAQELMDLLKNDALRIRECYSLFHPYELSLRILECYPLIDPIEPSLGLEEALAVNQKVRPQDAMFGTVLKQIARAACEFIPIYSFKINDKNANPNCFPPLIKTLTQGLYALACAMDSIMNMIEKGLAISDEEWKNCEKQLKLCGGIGFPIEPWSQLIANLFFHHAIVRNNISNAETMLKHGANINTLYPCNNTALHIAITNRESTNDENLKNQIDHLIYFLIINGASLVAKNWNGLTPLDLIPADSSLNEKIKYWRTL